MHADAVEFVPNGGTADNAAFGTLKVTGFLRGRTLNVNGLVHLPGLGDYQMSQIDKAVDRYKLDATRRNNDGADAEMSDVDQVQVLDRADPKQQTSLVKENIPDEMDAEQTFPTDEEIAAAQAETKRSKLVKRVPKGMSDYQACWIPDVEELNDDDDDDDMNDDEDAESDFMSCKSDQDSGDEFERDEQAEEFDDVSVSEAPVNNDKYDEGMFLSS